MVFLKAWPAVVSPEVSQKADSLAWSRTRSVDLKIRGGGGGSGGSWTPKQTPRAVLTSLELVDAPNVQDRVLIALQHGRIQTQ